MSTLAQQLLAFIQTQQLFDPTQAHVLLAFSGGVDSWVLAHLLREAKIRMSWAHVNFQLRTASDEDAAWARQRAEAWDVPYYERVVDTRAIAEEKGCSIQEAARALRYTFFEEVRQAEQLDVVLTAHHLDDQIETILWHLTRGTGLQGLTGIPLRNQNVVRPLLFTDKASLYNYAQAHELTWREDSSNAQTKYTRNKIRHKVVPILRGLNPNLSQTTARNTQYFREAAHLMQRGIEAAEQDIIQRREAVTLFDIEALEAHPARQTLLYHWLSEYQFTAGQIEQIASLTAQTGAQFDAPAHRLLVDRRYLILSAQAQTQANPKIKVAGQYFEHENLKLSLEICTPDQVHFERNPLRAYFDLKKLSLPLYLRHWTEGDRFQPFGMQGTQLLSDFFVNQKLSRHEKAATWLLLSEDEILWVVGQRSDNRFRVDAQTEMILVVTAEL